MTSPVASMTQAEFSRRRGVTRNAVTTWKRKGLLVLNEDGTVDVEKTEWNLDQRPANYRGGTTHRPIRSQPAEEPDPREVKPAPAPSREIPSSRPSDGGDDLPAYDPTSPNLSLADAVRRKENALGLQRMHDLEVARNEWVRVEDVAKLVELDYATLRERLLIIPGKIAALLVGLERPAIEGMLRQEVTEALNELHEPDDIAQHVASGDPTAARPARAEAAADPEPDPMGGHVPPGGE